MRVAIETINDALRFAETGERPSPKRTGRKARKQTGPPKYVSIAEDVVRLHDQDQRSFEAIARELGVSVGTVTRAYDHLRPGAVLRAVEQGQKPDHGRYRHLPPDIRTQIRVRLSNGERPAVIAATLERGRSSVYRIQKEMRSAPADHRQ